MSQLSCLGNGVLFDLDNTLYNRRAAFDSWLKSYLKNTLKVTDAKTAWELYNKIIDLDDNGYGPKEAVENILARLLTIRNPGSDGVKAKVKLFYEEFFETLEVDQSTREVLWLLTEKSIPWGIVTNGHARQWRKVEKLGLDKLTRTIFISDAFGSAKPDSKIFLAAASSLGVDPNEILFVGDDPINDISGALRAGMRAAWLSWGDAWPAEYSEFSPDYVFDSLRELIPIIIDQKSGV